MVAEGLEYIAAADSPWPDCSRPFFDRLRVDDVDEGILVVNGSGQSELSA